MGCGSCTSGGPAKAITLRHYAEAQILAAVMGCCVRVTPRWPADSDLSGAGGDGPADGFRTWGETNGSSRVVPVLRGKRCTVGTRITAVSGQPAVSLGMDSVSGDEG